MSALIFDLKNVATVKNKKGFEREIVSLFKNNDIPMVKYRVKKHRIKSLVNTIRTVKRKSFVDWLDGVQVNKDDFVPGDILQFGDFKLQVLSNKGIFGKVKDYNEGYIIEKFYWRGYSDDRCFKIGHEPI